MNWHKLVCVLLVALIVLHLLESPLKANGHDDFALLAGMARKHLHTWYGLSGVAGVLVWGLLPGGGKGGRGHD